MSHPGSIRNKRRARGGRALGLFVAVWLNLALAPCAMAYEASDDHDCPHCPTTEMQGHHGSHAGMDAEMPCADSMSDCSLDGDFSHDARSGYSASKDVQSEPPVAIVANGPVTQLRAPVHERSPPPFAKAHSGAPPPLHILHCVFLD